MRGILGGGHKPAGNGGEKAPDGPEVRPALPGGPTDHGPREGQSLTAATSQDETEQLDDAQGNVLLHMISQLVSRISAQRWHNPARCRHHHRHCSQTPLDGLMRRPIQKPGSDLSRISFPTFVLEPRSMLERITDFLSHPDLIFG